MKSAVMLFCLPYLGSLCMAFDTSTYSNLSITDLIEMEQSIMSSDEGLSFSFGKHKCIAVYSGDYRMIAEHKRGFIGMALRMFGSDPAFADYYIYEAQFSDNGVSFWMPIQENVRPFYEDVVSAGDAILIYYLYLGYDHDTEEWVFLNTEFQTL